jgi:23S rRNA pseudouridine2605 synthase
MVGRKENMTSFKKPGARTPANGRAPSPYSTPKPAPKKTNFQASLPEELAAKLDADDGAERLQKIIAMAGITSRRDAEDLISQGMVTVNGKTAKLGDKGILGKDAIKVNGKLLLSAPHKVYYLFYKPKNVIAMVNEDEEGRATIKDLTSKFIKERVFTVGRMDFTGEGAILLTNDGEMAQKILKSNEIIRRYHVKIDRHPTQEDVARLARGGRIEGRSMNPFHVRVVEAYTRNALVEISFEGMGAIDVRKYFENKGFFPERVARVGIGHLSADKMAPGASKRLDQSSVKALLAQPELAKKQIESAVQANQADYKVADEDQLRSDSTRGSRETRNDGKSRGRALDREIHRERSPRAEEKSARMNERVSARVARVSGQPVPRPPFGETARSNRSSNAARPDSRSISGARSAFSRNASAAGSENEKVRFDTRRAKAPIGKSVRGIGAGEKPSSSRRPTRGGARVASGFGSRPNRSSR